VNDRGQDGVLMLLFLIIVIADGGLLVNAPQPADGAGGVQDRPVSEVLPLPPCPKRITFRMSPVAATVEPPTTFSSFLAVLSNLKPNMIHPPCAESQELFSRITGQRSPFGWTGGRSVLGGWRGMRTARSREPRPPVRAGSGGERRGRSRRFPLVHRFSDPGEAERQAAAFRNRNDVGGWSDHHVSREGYERKLCAAVQK